MKTGNKWIAAIGAAALIAVTGAVAVGTAFAQGETPGATPNATPGVTQQGRMKMWRGFGFWGGSVTQFDAVAKALNLTPTQLFEQLHSGKTLEEIAQAQGVELQAVMDAMNAERIQAMKDKIAQAVADGRITQAQADWMLEGIEKGYMPLGRGGFGMFGRPGRGHGRGGWELPHMPTTPAPEDTSSSSGG